MDDQPSEHEPVTACDSLLGRVRRRRILRLVIGYALAALVAFIAVRIELLNHAAGSVLPRHEYYNDDPANGLTPWRSSIVTTEARWREFHIRHGSGEPSAGPLTAAERLQMDSDILRSQADNQLRGFVENVGVLQYLLVPLLAAMAVVVLHGHGIKAAIPLVIVAILGGVLMFYRGYFTSLGS